MRGQQVLEREEGVLQGAGSTQGPQPGLCPLPRAEALHFTPRPETGKAGPGPGPRGPGATSPLPPHGRAVL